MSGTADRQAVVNMVSNRLMNWRGEYMYERSRCVFFIEEEAGKVRVWESDNERFNYFYPNGEKSVPLFFSLFFNCLFFNFTFYYMYSYMYMYVHVGIITNFIHVHVGSAHPAREPIGSHSSS